MKSDLYLQKCEALRTLYVHENDISHALGINLEFRKRIDKILSNASLGINERKRLLKKYWQTYLFSAPYDFHSYLLNLSPVSFADCTIFRLYFFLLLQFLAYVLKLHHKPTLNVWGFRISEGPTSIEEKKGVLNFGKFVLDRTYRCPCCT